MRYIDPHVHMFSRTTDDYQRMAAAGITAVCEPAFWLGSDRTAPASFWDYFNHLTSVEPGRARRYGIAHYAMIGVNPKEAEDVRLTDDTIDGWDEFVSRENVVAIGEIGFNNITPNEERSFRRQAQYAEDRGMLVVVHLPHVDKPRGARRSAALLAELPITAGHVCIDHNTEATMDDAGALAGCWRGLTVYPGKLTPDQAAAIVKRWGTERILINSSADWGESDPLAVVATAEAMRRVGLSEADIRKVLYENPQSFYGQSRNFRLIG
jgi:hypothetical protein